MVRRTMGGRGKADRDTGALATQPLCQEAPLEKLPAGYRQTVDPAPRQITEYTPGASCLTRSMRNW